MVVSTNRQDKGKAESYGTTNGLGDCRSKQEEEEANEQEEEHVSGATSSDAREALPLRTGLCRSIGNPTNNSWRKPVEKFACDVKNCQASLFVTVKDTLVQSQTLY